MRNTAERLENTGAQAMNDKNAIDKNSRVKFEEESVKYIDSLYRNALELVRNTGDAEDLVQETYLKAYRYYQTFQEGTNLKAWLFKIQYNTFVHRYRRSVMERDIFKKVANRSEAGDAISENTTRALTDAEGVAMWPIIKGEIDKALQDLPAEYRLMVTMADVEGLKYKEIAEATGSPLGTVMSRIHRARKMLRERLLGRAGEDFARDSEGSDRQPNVYAGCA
jgi:RNA polymerase sigma-70 factor, ECF subfamily